MLLTNSRESALVLVYMHGIEAHAIPVSTEHPSGMRYAFTISKKNKKKFSLIVVEHDCITHALFGHEKKETPLARSLYICFLRFSSAMARLAIL